MFVGTKDKKDWKFSIQSYYKKQPPEVLYKKGGYKNLAQFTRKRLYWRLFFNTVVNLIVQLVKKDSSTGVFL